MNFLVSLVYMYFMLTFIYPVLSKTFGIDNKIGFFISFKKFYINTLNWKFY